MAVKNLVTFGDSWPAGAELQWPREASFPVQIAEYLEIKSLNLAVSGTSADQSVYHLLNYPGIKWSDTLVLFCLTGITRSMYFDKKDQEIHPMSSDTVSMAYYKYIHSNELDQFNRIRNILTVQQYCQSMGSKVLFVNNWDKTPDHHSIDSNLFYNKTLTKILNIEHNFDSNDVTWHTIKQHQYIHPNQCHPNADGHLIIANELTTWIKKKIYESVS